MFAMLYRKDRCMKLKNGMEVRPLAGHCFVRLESLYKGSIEGIIIPQKYRSARHIIGRVVDVTMKPQDLKVLGFKLEVNDRLILDHTGGRLVDDNVFDYPIIRQSPMMNGKRKPECTILALVGDDVDLSAHSQDMERCRWCGDAKAGISQSMLLMNGVCPRCHKDRYGVVQPTNPDVKVSDAEVEEFSDIIHGRG